MSRKELARRVLCVSTSQWPDISRSDLFYPSLAVHVLQIPHSPKGVSTQAIKKYIDEHGMSSDFADGWEKRLNKTFESMTEHGTLSKIKASFRLTKEGKGEYHTMWAKDHPDEAEEEHLTLLEKRRVAAEAKTKEKEGGGKTPKISGGVEKPRATKAAKAH
ncbi:hypothetical protein FOA52_012330 [Chlamydomonas sp. UWO 241]|nr:hypothetical protein FOA52_012330 [Chlamydomonas sp. UWO 241]